MNGVLRTSYSIAKVVRTNANGTVSFPQGWRPVKIRCFNEAMNYALLELQDGRNDLTPLVGLSLDEMLDDMRLDPEHISVEDSRVVLDIEPSEFRTKIKCLTFL